MNQALPRSDSPGLNGVITEIDRFLSSAVRGRGLPEVLEEAVCYTVAAGGKRLRPALVVLCCEAAGGDRQKAMNAAAAIELVHTFSLVHDDLPAMDDDGMRRGRPSLHVHAGEAAAILAGDVMMSICFELIGETPVEARQIVALVRELAAATTAMIGGQVFDTIGGLPPELTDEQRLGIIHRNKTGALLRAACRMGAVCGDADPDTLALMTRYGSAIGLMFQIVDDLLDVTQSAEHIGKATGKDLEAGKLTYPGVLGVDRSRAEIRRLQDEPHAALEPLGPLAEPLLELCDDMAVRTR